MPMKNHSGKIAAPLCWALLVSASLGCGGGQKKAEPTLNPNPPQQQQQQPEPQTVPDKPPTVMLRLDGIAGGKPMHELAPGESLKSGDKMAVNVAVDAPAYVYVALGSASGPPQIVFPKTGDQKVTPDQPLRIPANPDKWITLDNNTGQEDVFVYASPKPIPSAELTNLVNTDAANAKKNAAKRSAKGPPKAKVIKPKSEKGGGEESLSASNRGVSIEDDDDGGQSSGSAPGSPHIAIKRFSITHK
jgi:hypothetical protein